MNLDLKGAMQDVVPLLTSVWSWVTAHYLIVMGFALAMALIVVIGKRR